MAGFRELLAVEWDDHAAECFRLNFPDVIFTAEISAIFHRGNPSERTKLEKGDLGVFDGSPPCQGFSTSGSGRNFDDNA